jgi:hypothetical protein
MAKTEAEIILLWQDMERRISLYRKWRRMHTRAILEELRDILEAIPAVVTDELFDDLKRGVFALDVLGDYHPGDPEAEANDLQENQPLNADDYIRADPNLGSRPGFAGDFQGDLPTAADTVWWWTEQACVGDAMVIDEQEDGSAILDEMMTGVEPWPTLDLPEA